LALERQDLRPSLAPYLVELGKRLQKETP